MFLYSFMLYITHILFNNMLIITNILFIQFLVIISNYELFYYERGSGETLIFGTLDCKSITNHLLNVVCNT